MHILSRTYTHTHQVDSGKAAVLVASILVHCKSTLMSESGVLSLWESSKLDWTKLGVNSQHLAEFLQKQVSGL